MSDEDALLAAIAANPVEDTPRLAFADWLDEHDQPIRAEFIRLQIEIARKQATLPRVLLNRHVDLFKRNQELLDNQRGKLLGPLAVLPDVVKIDFHRGFVDELTLDCGQFYAFGNAIAAARPTPRVAVVDEVAEIRRFLGVGESPPAPRELVTAIRTRENKAGEDDAIEAETVAAVGRFNWPLLEELDISGCRLGDDLFFVLAFLDSDLLPALSDLDASVNDLTDTVLTNFLAFNLPTKLTRLILGGNPISDAGAVALAESWPQGDADKLEHLNLKFTNIGTRGQQALLDRFGGRVDLF